MRTNRVVSLNIPSRVCVLLALACLFSHSDDIQEIEKLLISPDENIDIGLVSLLLAHDVDHTVPVQQYLELLNRMASVVKDLSGDSENPKRRIGALNALLFQSGPWNKIGPGQNVIYKYDPESTLKPRFDALFMGELLKNQKGTCATLPTLWYAIADRLKWPVKILRLPGHFALRYDTGKESWNIEATADGGAVETARYIEDFNIPKGAIDKGTYLRPLSKKEFVSSLLVNNGSFHYERNKDKIKALRILRMALNYDSTNVMAMKNLGELSRDSTLIEKAFSLGFTDKISNQYSSRLREIYSQERTAK